MALSKDSIKTLEASILEGTFPDSDEFLKADLSVQSIPLLLASISQAKDDLGIEIQDISKEKAQDVDDWILQAKRVQDDIARCKLEARQIVEEHERVEAKRGTATETSTKVQLLLSEIRFNQALQHELESIGEIGQVLEEAGKDSREHRPTQSVERLVSAQASISRISQRPSRNLLEQIDNDLRQKVCSQLRDALDETCIVEREEERGWIEILKGQPSHKSAVYKIPVSKCLQAFEGLGLVSEASELVLAKLERALLPLLSKRTNVYPATVRTTQEKLTLSFAPSRPEVLVLLQIVEEVLVFLHAALPLPIKDNIAKQLTPKLIFSLTTNWLDDAVPYDLSAMESLQELRSRVSGLASTLASFSWPGHQDLTDWLDQIPRTWLNRRRMTSLNAVRMAFRAATTNTRQVERVERQLVKNAVYEPENDAEEDNWNANWDDEQIQDESETTNGEGKDEETSGWDFETESNHSDAEVKTELTQENEDDTGEAWGWRDESPTEGQKADFPITKPANSNTKITPAEEVVLKELYIITDIPDYVLEVIGKDMFDAQAWNSSQADTIFTSSAPTSALRALPTLVLAMFRATAPTYYSHSRNLSNMNLYNDVSYIVQKVTETTDAQTRPILQPALDTMLKFARQTYTRELDIQRTILSDLLDGAQGFVSCNSDQYRELSANAVSAVVDRIRQLQQEYRDILGQSHLLQTIGSLIGMVIGKVIGDIEDLEDISEKESDRLVEYCRQITSLEDLFVATKPSDSPSGQHLTDNAESPQQVSTIALYVPNYFRFQYLAEILKSSLADIKFLWTEGGLKSDFSAEEVVDLIKALFSESHHRRNAIGAIRGSV